MKLSSQFDVPAAPDKVVALFFDPGTMRECLPGCEELEQVDEKTYRGVLTSEIAHVKFKASFSAVITSVEQPADSSQPAVINAVLKGEDRRLGSTIKVDATMTIVPVGEASQVTYELEMAMWGKLGRLGESVIRRRSTEVERQFSEALAAVCAGQPIPHRQQTKKATRSLGTSSAPVGTTEGASDQAVQLGDVGLTPNARNHTQDLPFLVAVAAAAFAYGIILGGRKRRR
jgi:carbon monoxide dehydrogenase subunit G